MTTKESVSWKFRPQDLSRRLQFCYRLKVTQQGKVLFGRGFNWVKRRTGSKRLPWLENWHGAAHYLTKHAPGTIKTRWQKMRKRLEARTWWYKARINERL